MTRHYLFILLVNAPCLSPHSPFKVGRIKGLLDPALRCVQNSSTTRVAYRYPSRPSAPLPPDHPDLAPCQYPLHFHPCQLLPRLYHHAVPQSWVWNVYASLFHPSCVAWCHRRNLDFSSPDECEPFPFSLLLCPLLPASWPAPRAAAAVVGSIQEDNLATRAVDPEPRVDVACHRPSTFRTDRDEMTGPRSETSDPFGGLYLSMAALLP